MTPPLPMEIPTGYGARRPGRCAHSAFLESFGKFWKLSESFDVLGQASAGL
jgi:hypothetical protein